MEQIACDVLKTSLKLLLHLENRQFLSAQKYLEKLESFKSMSFIKKMI